MEIQATGEKALGTEEGGCSAGALPGVGTKGGRVMGVTMGVMGADDGGQWERTMERTMGDDGGTMGEQ